MYYLLLQQSCVCETVSSSRHKSCHSMLWLIKASTHMIDLKINRYVKGIDKNQKHVDEMVTVKKPAAAPPLLSHPPSCLLSVASAPVAVASTICFILLAVGGWKW
uniref:Uncharacterized protein n=1 Tax=Octopus bimaculoides TaxID=37653 RepID=A0A0L8HVS6_OCTBM